MITHAHIRALFDYDPEGFLVYRIARGFNGAIGRRAGCVGNNGYRQIKVDGVRYSEHRLIWLWHHGTVPPALDHIDRVRSNNRIENLRPATTSENHRNRSKAAGMTSKWKGVSWHKDRGMWRVQITTSDGKCAHIGHFSDEADAALAYNFAALEHYGEFAVLNEAEQTWKEADQ